MRAFIAIDLPDELRRDVGELLARLPGCRDTRWCTAAQLHITLKFLGQIADDAAPQVPQIMRAAALTAGVQPFELTVGGLGAFPTSSNPRVVWLGVEDAGGGCARWVAAADPLLGRLGIAPEQRPFHPHLTLGRGKSPLAARDLRAALPSIVAPPPRAWTVRELVLFESRLSPGGAVYTPVQRVSLA